jgi:two-component system probable response regulator PhcQ
MSEAAVIKRSVVIADDDPDVAKVLARVVRALGHDARTADNGVEALELLRAEKADVLLSDIDMPQMDGVTLVSHVRAEGLAPVRILLTANARLDTAIKAINSGEIHRYIQKPWKHAELVSTLEEAFMRVDDLSRIGAADHAVKRWKAARDALEAEFPGITKIDGTGEVYKVDELRARAVINTYEGSTLHALVTGAQESDGIGDSFPPSSRALR